MTYQEKKNIYNAIQNLYNMDGNTWQEVLAMMYNLVADTTQKFETIEQKFDLMLGSEVTKAIKQLYENGTLTQIINSEVFKNLNSKIDYLKDIIEKNRKEINEQLDNNTKQLQTFFNVKTFLCDDGQYVQGNNAHDDTTGIQKAFDLAKQYRGTVYFPIGNYVITNSLKVGHYTTILGETSKGSVINNQTIKLDKPQLIDYTNDTQMEIVIQNMCFRGGTHGIYSASGLQSITLDNVRFELQTKQAINSQKYLMVGSFKNVIFNRCNTALKVSNGVVNHNNFIDCQFLNLVDTGIEFNLAEVNNFIGCRFEGGGTIGKTLLWFRQSKNIQFDGCYFENTHKQLLLESNSKQGTIFKNCHFTYPPSLNDGLPKEFIFTSDELVTFENNSWNAESNGAKDMILKESYTKLGNLDTNTYLQISKDSFKGISSTILINNGDSELLNIPLLKIFGDTTSSSTSSIQTVTGEILINFSAITKTGFPVNHVYKYLVTFIRIGTDNIKTKIVPIYENKLDIRGDTTISIFARAGAVAAESHLDLNLTGTTDLKSGSIKLSYDFLKSSTTRENYLDIRMI